MPLQVSKQGIMKTECFSSSDSITTLELSARCFVIRYQVSAVHPNHSTRTGIVQQPLMNHFKADVVVGESISALSKYLCNFITFHNLLAPSFLFQGEGQQINVSSIRWKFNFIKSNVLEINTIKNWQNPLSYTYAYLYSPSPSWGLQSEGVNQFCHTDGAVGLQRPLIF